MLILIEFSIFSVISDSGKASENPSGVKRLIFCTGRVYYDLIKARREKGLEGDIAISTVEQVSLMNDNKMTTKLMKLNFSSRFHHSHSIW